MKTKSKVGRPREIDSSHRYSTKQWLQHQTGKRISRTPKTFVLFDACLDTGSIWQDKPYSGKFRTPQEALMWWTDHRKKFIKGRIKDAGNPGTRPNIFWELEFGIDYPTDEESLLLLESHSLWYPGEKEKLIADGVKIPETEFTGCLIHPCGYPIRWSKEPAIKIEDGEWFRYDCQCTQKLNN